MTSQHAPLVSVGMAVHNCEKTVETAMRSILRQSYGEWELIVIDDGSTDRTLELALSFDDSRIRIIDGGAQKGISARLNQPIALAQGEYFARMDGDDVAYPERLERQVRYLEVHPEIDLLGAGILVFKSDGRAIGTRTIWRAHEEICRRPWAGFYLPHSTWMAKTAWFRDHPYREDALIGDLDLLLNTYETSRFESLPEILVGYREEYFSLRKALKERRYFIDRLARQSFRGGNDYSADWRGIVEQALKAMTEIFATATHLNYRVLGHRALPIDASALMRWEQVWLEATDSTRPSAIQPCNSLAGI